jgi:hypothetical protein
LLHQQKIKANSKQENFLCFVSYSGEHTIMHTQGRPAPKQKPTKKAAKQNKKLHQKHQTSTVKPAQRKDLDWNYCLHLPAYHLSI